MIVTHTVEDGQERIYFTRYASIESYFTDDGEGGVALHLVPGFCAYLPEFERNKPALREAILADAAQRLMVEPDQVLAQPMKRFKQILTPALAAHYRFARRPKERNASRA